MRVMEGYGLDNFGVSLVWKQGGETWRIDQHSQFFFFADLVDPLPTKCSMFSDFQCFFFNVFLSYGSIFSRFIY